MPSPTAVHQDFCVEPLLTLRVNCPPEYLVSIDLSMRVDRRNEPRPDVVVIRRKHAGRSPVPVEDALLAVEVVSPTSTSATCTTRRRSTPRRIASYWVVDPAHERVTLTEYALGGNREYEQVRTPRICSSPSDRGRSPWTCPP